MRRLKLVAMLLLVLPLLVVFASLGSCGRSDLSGDVGRVVVRRYLTADPKTLDPHLAGDVPSSTQVGMVYEQLYEYDYFAKPRKVVPALAASMPEVSEDGLSVTVKLKKGVMFQDDPAFPGGKGREMKADDVVFSLKRFAALRDTPGFWIADGKFKGLNEFRQRVEGVTAVVTSAEQRARVELDAIIAADVEAVEKIDDYTVRYHLVKPHHQLTYELCMSYFAIVPVEAVRAYGSQFFTKPVGTGPFRLEHWKFKHELLWQRNPTYREAYYPEVPLDHVAADGAQEREKYLPYVGKRLPLADEMRFRIIKESQASWLEFLAGTLDATGMESDQFTESVQNDELTDKMIAKGIELQKYDRASIEYIAFNMDDPVIGRSAGKKGQAIRKAVSYALDRQGFIDRYLNSRGSVATMLVFSGLTGYDPEFQFEPSKYDPAKGRSLLQEAGFEMRKTGTDRWECIDPATNHQVKVEILCRGTSKSSQDMSSFLTFAGRSVGINIVAPTIEFSEFLTRGDEGRGQAYNSGWVLDYPDAGNILMLLHGDNAKDYGVNSSRFKNAEFDRLFDEMNPLAADDPRKIEMVQQMHRIVEEDAPWATIYYQKLYNLTNSWYAPTVPNDFAYNLFKYAASDSELRARKVDEWSEMPALPAILILLLASSLVALFILRVVRVS